MGDDLERARDVRAHADRVYRCVARNRYRLGCGDDCQSRPLDEAFRDS